VGYFCLSQAKKNEISHFAWVEPATLYICVALDGTYISWALRRSNYSKMMAVLTAQYLKNGERVSLQAGDAFGKAPRIVVVSKFPSGCGPKTRT
jgi:bifunctional pyridoxal-dependent enzyme with beta-cystathionase and maltose regulon repressor activities